MRDALKQDISDGIIGPVQTQMAANTLPPFGASFVNGIADTAIDREVTDLAAWAVLFNPRYVDVTSKRVQGFFYHEQYHWLLAQSHLQ